MTRRSLWEDTTNGVMIPPDYRLPAKTPDWVWFNYFMFYLGLKSGRYDPDDVKDPYQIWTVINYLDEYDSDEKEVFLKYQGENENWKFGVDEVFKSLHGLYGCVIMSEEKLFLHPYIDDPPKGTAEKLKNKEQVKIDCERLKRPLIEIDQWLGAMVKKRIEDKIDVRRPERNMNPSSLKNLKQYRDGSRRHGMYRRHR